MMASSDFNLLSTDELMEETTMEIKRKDNDHACDHPRKIPRVQSSFSVLSFGLDGDTDLGGGTGSSSDECRDPCTDTMDVGSQLACLLQGTLQDTAVGMQSQTRTQTIIDLNRPRFSSSSSNIVPRQAALHINKNTADTVLTGSSLTPRDEAALEESLEIIKSVLPQASLHASALKTRFMSSAHAGFAGTKSSTKEDNEQVLQDSASLWNALFVDEEDDDEDAVEWDDIWEDYDEESTQPLGQVLDAEVMESDGEEAFAFLYNDNDELESTFGMQRPILEVTGETLNATHDHQLPTIMEPVDIGPKSPHENVLLKIEALIQDVIVRAIAPGRIHDVALYLVNRRKKEDADIAMNDTGPIGDVDELRRSSDAHERDATKQISQSVHAVAQPHVISRDTDTQLPVGTSKLWFYGTRSMRKFTIYIYLLNILHSRLSAHQGTSTKRDLYYSNPQLFRNQAVVDIAIDDICATLGVTRREIGVVGGFKGLIAGAVEVFIKKEKNKRFPGVGGHAFDGASYAYPREPEFETVRVNVHDVAGRQGMLVPAVSEISSISAFSGATMVLVVEKEATFHDVLKSVPHELLAKWIIVTGKGYPDLNTRQFLVFLHKTCPHLRYYIVTDADPHGLAIALTYKYGSRALSHEENASLEVLQWVGVPLVYQPVERVNNPVYDVSLSEDGSELLPLTANDDKKARLVLNQNVYKRKPMDEDVLLMRKTLQKMLWWRKKAEMQYLGPGGVVNYMIDFLRKRGEL